MYTLPPIYIAIPGTTIIAAQHNDPLVDLQTANNYARPVIAGGTGSNNATGARNNLGVAYIADTVTLTDVQTLSNKTFTDSVPIASADAGATAGPLVDLYRNSASPAASDFMGEIDFSGRNSTPAKVIYAAIRSMILDPIAATEDALLQIRTIVAGTLATRFSIGQGLWGTVAGGDMGPDSANLNALFIGGLPTSANLLAGLKVQVTTAAQVQITATGGLSVTADLSVSGVNGLDTGAEASNTWYNVFTIWNGATVASLLSLSASAPTMPAGYTQKLRVGVIRNDGSSNLWRTLQYGNLGYLRSGVNPTAPPSMASGPAGSINTPTWVGVDTSSFVPPTAASILVEQINTGSNFNIMVNPNNSAGAIGSNTNPPWSAHQGISSGSGPAPSTVPMPLESATIYWATDSSNSRLICRGWVDNL